MKSTTVAASTLLSLAAAQGPPHGFGPGGMSPFAAFPSCVSNCYNQVRSSASDCSAGDYSCLCTGDTITTLNSCIDSSSCSASEKSDTYEAIAQLCANAGSSVTASPEATWSATSGGSAWPTAWTTNSAWTSVVSQWGGAPGGGPPGWNNNGGWGPFGSGTAHGWGPWAASSTGSWTNGPWADWWGTSACPPSTWSGWTKGPWGTNAPWTTWTGCQASTTATAVVTGVVTSSGSTVTTTSTSFGIQVAQATNGGAKTGSTGSSSGGAAAPTMRLMGAAAGVVGVVGGALLL